MTGREFVPEKLPAEPIERLCEMDDLMARTMVENLTLGINPITGQALSESDSCSSTTVQEALRIVLANCSLKSYGTVADKHTKENARKKRRRAAKASEAQHVARKQEERSRLIEMCQEGKSVLDMAKEFKCSTDEICVRLKELR